jgi:hypothetical protein
MVSVRLLIRLIRRRLLTLGRLRKYDAGHARQRGQ